MNNRVLAICKAELMIRFRNFWVVLAIAILTLFALVLGFAGSAPGGALEVSRLVLMVSSLVTLSMYLVPLLALLLSFDSLAGEAEQGTLLLMLTYPLKRSELVLGKFLGHLVVLGIAVIGSYGLVGGILLAMNWDPVGLTYLLALIASSIFFGAVFLALGTAISASVRQSGTAAGLALGFWLVFVVLYDIGLFGALVADAGGFFTKEVFPWAFLASPGESFKLINMTLIETGGEVAAGLDSIGKTFPLPIELAYVSLLVWLISALAAATFFFRRMKP